MWPKKGHMGMSNLATHKVQGVGQAVENAGARLLYLPPYSLDFNPIENLWRHHSPRFHRNRSNRFSGATISIDRVEGSVFHRFCNRG